MTNMKKLLAVLLCMAMLVSMTACGQQTDTPTEAEKTPTAAPTEAGKDSETEAPTEPVVEYPDYVTEPVTITWWHNRGGEHEIVLQDLVKKFNETNEYGITVVMEYQGNYNDILAKVKASYGTEVNCNMTIVGAGGIEELAENGCFVDLAEYVARDNFDLENIPEGLRYYMQHWDGKVVEFPIWVSTTLLYYNKAYFDEAPKTIQEWAAKSKEIKDEHDIYGMGMLLDCGFIQRPILKSLGAPGLTLEDGTAPALINDGDTELVTYLTDWKSWIDEGYAHPLTSTGASANIRNAFYAGTCASMVDTSANLWTVLNSCKESGVEVGVAYSVGYDGYTAGLGGGGIAVMADSTQQEIAACWEFIKFMMADEQQLATHKISGYLPFNYTATDSSELTDFWKEYPEFAVAYESLDWATYNDWSLHLAEWRSQVSNVFSYVLVDGSMTPEDGIEYLKQQALIIFE